MRKRKKSKVLLLGAGLTIVTVASLTGWAMGRANGRPEGQVPALQSGGQARSGTVKSDTASGLTASSQAKEASSHQELPEASSPAQVQEVSAPPAVATSGMQIAQAIAGDFSSMEGVWVNGNGETLTFGSTGLIDGKGQIQGLKASAYGTASGNLAAETFGGETIELLPAGAVFPDYVYDREGEETTASDASDKQQDRIWLGQDLVSIAEVSSFYYRRN